MDPSSLVSESFDHVLLILQSTHNLFVVVVFLSLFCPTIHFFQTRTSSCATPRRVCCPWPTPAPTVTAPRCVRNTTTSTSTSASTSISTSAFTSTSTSASASTSSSTSTSAITSASASAFTYPSSDWSFTVCFKHYNPHFIFFFFSFFPFAFCSDGSQFIAIFIRKT
jgi:hypothetical protein